MKVVINTCHGGFGLSEEAIIAYLKKYDKQVWLAKNKYRMSIYYLVPPEEQIDFNETPENWHEMSDQERSNYNGKYSEQIFQDGEIPREDPHLVEVVEKLGEKANGNYAQLKVVEIPDDVKWEIEEYDGSEWVSEVHRTWS